MKKIILGLGLLIASALSVHAQGLENFIVEKFYVTNAADNAGNGSTGTSLPTGSVVWRFYADMAPGWQLQSVYGDPNHQLIISTTTSFFNNLDRGSDRANAINGNFIGTNTNYIDSYITLGGTCSNRLGVLKTEDDATNNLSVSGGYLQNNDASAGQPLTVRDGQTGTTATPAAITIAGFPNPLDMFDNPPSGGSSLVSDPINGGAWATTPGAVGPTATNRVLIAQITSDGVLTYNFNLQIRNTTTLVVENWVSSNAVGGEQVLAALAGTVNQANALPTAAVTNPINGTSFLVGQPVTIDATASDADGTVTNVEFLVDNVVVGSDNTAPYSFVWNATVGSHSITARATDDLGGTGTSSAVNILVGNVLPPSVSITSPTNGTTFVLGDVATIDANASDVDGTVTNVEFFVDGVSIGSDATSPYSINWPVVLGVHNITATATDNDNATATTAPISVTVYDSSAAYALVSSNNPCSQNNFCLPIIAITPVNDVIGYDIVLSFDNTKVLPTGVVTVGSDLITPSYVTTANSINAGAGLMYLSVFFNAGAPLNAEFNGTGELLCVQFARTAGFGAQDTADFQINSLQESYFNGVQPKVVSPGSYSTYQESSFNSHLQFWFDGSPIRYDAVNTASYLITNIYGTDASCSNQSAIAVQPNTSGDFSYDYANGTSIDISKDIPNAISVQPVINGFDAFLTRRVLINDATFVPSVYQMIAMDVNTDGVVSAGDLSQINQRAVLIIDEFRQDWNYGSNGVSNGQPSKDWLFIDGTTLSSDPAYQISSNFPFDDGTGYSKSNVPQVPFCLEVPYQTSATCNAFGIENYTGILLGDVNGNFATNSTGGPFRLSNDKKVVFDLSKAIYGNGYVEVPVVAISNENVNALDFAVKFNENKMSFAGANATANGMESLVNYNNADHTVRFTSYSLQNYDLSVSPVSVRFNTTATEITKEDLMNATAYLNGEEVSVEIIGSRVSGAEAMVNVFPNPASDMINVITSENANMQLMDANGRVVMAQDNMNAYQKYEFKTSGLAKGIYLMKIFGDNVLSVKKVIVE
ncbi:MAG TPA: Ig-like domain-containing protein [Bacteroidia bacterium]|nr:Ig-like domain-containing protein [Bacteroidia bacterium]